MPKSKLEYIWLDGYDPTQSLRSKTKIVDDFSGDLADAPIWSFDCSSTEQANGSAHASNGRATIDDDDDFWFGFEQ